jgi:glycosyltransferase involved in cell wall biosynthesis
VSIVVPVYNGGRYLSRCLESVLAQTIADIEVLVVDDGSTDESGDVAGRYARQDRRLRVVRHTQNHGLHLARISGALAASGEFLGYVDSDDIVSAGMFDHLYQEAKRSGADVVRTGAWLCREGTVTPPVALAFRERAYDSGIQYLDADFYPAMCLHLHHRRLWQLALPHFPSVRVVGEDNLTSFVLAFFADRVVSLSTVMYSYVERDDSLSGDQSLDNVARHIIDRAAVVKLLKEFVDREGGRAMACWNRIRINNRDLVLSYIGALTSEPERRRAMGLFEEAWSEPVPSERVAAWERLRAADA